MALLTAALLCSAHQASNTFYLPSYTTYQASNTFYIVKSGTVAVLNDTKEIAQLKVRDDISMISRRHAACSMPR